MMRIRRSIGKPALLAGCALGAWLAIAPSAASAQAFQGNGAVVTGDATITPGAGSTSILLNAQETVINWTPFDTAGTGTIDFLPAGTQALFRGGSETFTVLNRVIPRDGQGIPTARAISLNGTVLSLRQDPVTFNRGNVWFYSPTGIIVGPTAILNVGSLILTTNDIGFVPNSNSGPGFIYGPGGEVKFTGPADSTGLVEIQNGAQLSALGPNAYLALVAPRVVQRGTVTADGQVAYIAAEAVDMRISAGLFDFTVVAGTTDENGVVHTGTTTGPASTDFFADPQRIAMVAVPKNDALTMLLSGSIGYTPAASASNDGSSIILTAGFETPEPFTFVGFDDSSIEIGPATFRNPLQAWATDRINVLPQGGTTRFGGRTFLNAGGTVEIDVIEREFVIADSDLILNAGRPGTGGTVDLYASTADNLPGGSITVAGTLSADASSYGILFVTEPPLDGQGGSVIMDADGGTISANFVSAVADGYGDNDSVQGGMGTGGTIDIVARDFGTIEAQFVDLYASGYGGYSGGGDGGDGLGGDITLRGAGGTLAFGSVFLGAHGSGGDGGALAGDGTSGTAAVSITGQAQAWDNLTIVANAFPGRRAGESFGQTGSATGQPGAASLAISGDGALTLTGLSLTSNALMYVSGQPGFTGQGGGVDLSVTAGGELTVTGGIFADASALFGGEGIFFDPDSTPTLQGGQVSVTADGGTITAFELEVRADAHGLHGSAAAGDATGGTVSVSALNGGRILLDDDSGTSLLTLSANGLGTPGPNPSNAFGGTAQLIVEDGSVTVFGDIEVSASGQIGRFFEPPPDGPGHNATGGTASVELRAGTLGTASIEADDLAVSAIGDGRLILTVGTLGPGGDPIRGDGGDGTGGTAGLTVAAGTLTIDSMTLDSSGTGGASAVRSGPAAWVSGNGFGGASQVAVDGGIANIVTLDIVSNGIGGDGTAGPSAEGSELAAVAGEGTGGLASLAFGGSGMLRVTDATLEANGLGAQGMDHIDDGDATDGGIGTGGTATLSTMAGWSGSFQSATLALRGNGIGGVGGLSDGASATPPTGVNGDGGAGFGGAATVDLADGQFTLGPVTLEANGTGGNSGDAGSGLPGAFGGQGIGGAARFALIDSPAGPLGSRSLDSLLVDASGFGGLGSQFTEQSGAGGAQLTVTVLDSASALGIPGSLLVYANGCCITGGTGIQALISGAPLDVGADIAMVATGPLSVDAVEPLRAGGFVTLDGLIVNTTGLIQSGSAMTVQGLFGVTAEHLTSGDTTFLSAPNGPLLVGNLNSVDLVTAGGESVEIRSTGGLDFTFADATGGDLLIDTAGNLTFGSALSVQAAGSATLATSAGNITASDIAAGTFVYVDSSGSADLRNLDAGTDAAVTTRGGNLTVGNVTAGDDTWLSVFGTDPTRILTAGNLVTTGLGDDTAAGPPTLFEGAGPTGNVARLRSSGSLVIGDMQSPGRAILVADAGTTTAGDLSADEALIVLGRGNIALDAITTEGRFYVADSAMFLPNLPDAYDPASLDGLTPVRTGGGLTIGSAVQAGDITVAVAGTATAPSWASAGRLFIDSGGLFTSNVLVSAGGNASITADNGIDLTALTVGGTTVLRSPLGAVEIGNLLSTGAVTARGRSVDIASGGALTFADLDATAGNILVATTGNLGLVTADATGTTTLSSSSGSIAATGAVVSGGAVSATGPAGVSFVSLSSGGTTLLRATGGAVDVDQLLSTGAVTALGRSVDIGSTGALTFADLDATSGNLVVATGGNLALATADATGTATLTSTGGSIAATGAVNSGGAFAATASAGLTFASLTSGGTTLLSSANGAIDVNALSSSGLVSVTGRGVFLDGLGPLSFATAVSTGQTAISASGNLTFAAIESDLDLTLTSTGGSITATGDVRGGFPNLTAANDILIEGNLNSLGTLVVNAGGSFTVEGDTGADDAQITADLGITMASLQSGEITRLDAPNGNILIPELRTGGRVTARGLDVNITSSGSLLFDEARASREDLRLTVADDLTIGEAFASDAILLDAGGIFSLSGTARGFTIDVTSADIALGAESRLGLRDATSDVTLRNGQSESPSYVGGNGGPSETWSLNRNEATRVFADESITILSDGDITIDDLAMSFGAGGTNIGAGGLLEISSPDRVRIVGDVALSTSGPDDTFRIDPSLIALDTGTGSIAMTLFAGEGGGGGTPQGRLELIGDRIVAATGANITQLETLTDLDAITALLAQPGGTGEPLSAGTIHLDVIESLYIQNSGASEAFADRRGFVASGLEIATESNATQIAINGRILAPGGAVTGLEVTPLVSINGAPAAAGGQFHPRSTINGCVIGADCNPPEIPDLDLPTSEDVESPVPDQGEGSLFVAPLIELAGTEPLITPPLVDEPITGVGNDDLWESRCEPGEEDSPCPEDDGQP